MKFSAHTPVVVSFLPPGRWKCCVFCQRRNRNVMHSLMSHSGICGVILFFTSQPRNSAISQSHTWPRTAGSLWQRCRCWSALKDQGHRSFESARRPAAVIRMRVTSIRRPPATMRSMLVVANRRWSARSGARSWTRRPAWSPRCSRRWMPQAIRGLDGAVA